MKYVMFERKYLGIVQKTPIIFPNYLNHIDIAQVLQILDPNFKPVSAGHCYVDVDLEEGRGSVSTGLKPDAEDASIIRTHDYLQGL
jgi:hypothetical protein